MYLSGFSVVSTSIYDYYSQTHAREAKSDSVTEAYSGAFYNAIYVKYIVHMIKTSINISGQGK